jgi:hypothetical protein
MPAQKLHGCLLRLPTETERRAVKFCHGKVSSETVGLFLDVVPQRHATRTAFTFAIEPVCRIFTRSFTVWLKFSAAALADLRQSNAVLLIG